MHSMALTRRMKHFAVPLALTLLVILIYYKLFIVRTPLRETSAELIDEYPNVSNEFCEQHLKVDCTHRSDDDILRELQEHFPNFPVTVWLENRHRNLYYKNKTCAPFPTVYSLKINNLYWQILNTINGTFYMYGAYYDVRKRSPIGSSIRILAMVDRLFPSVRTYCQIWFPDRQEPVFVEATEYHLIWNIKWSLVPGVYYSYLITCPIKQSDNGTAPTFVSLVERMCDRASNILHVIYNKPTEPEKKGGFAVCVKNLDIQHTDLSVRMIEWIELMRLLGAQRIYFYDLNVHKNVTKVLKYYEKRGDIEVSPITYPGDQPNIAGLQHLYSYGPEARVSLQRQQNILISLNDCFYKSIYTYDYLALLDTDEVIMPLKTDNWTSLMKTVLGKISARGKTMPSHFTAKNTLFVPDSNSSYEEIPSYMYMLQHVLREKEYFLRGPKSFFDTEMVEIVHNHWPISCLAGDCVGYPISTKDAQMHHYREEIYDDIKHEQSTKEPNRVNDTTIWRYKEPLIDRCLAVLNDLGFFG